MWLGVFCLMFKVKLSYLIELILLIPFFPLLYLEGKKIRKKVVRLQPVSEYIHLKGIRKDKSILVIGESTAAGVGASHTDYSLGANLFNSFNQEFTLMNLGKNGLKAEKLKSLLQHGLDNKTRKFDIMVIMIGANDCFKFTPPHKFLKQLEDFIELGQSQLGTVHFVIPSIPPVHQFPAIPGLLRFFLGWHRKLLAGIASAISSKSSTVSFLELEHSFDPMFYAEDGIHPSDQGYQEIAKLISEEIRKSLQKQSGPVSGPPKV